MMNMSALPLDPYNGSTHLKFHNDVVAPKRSEVKYELANFDTVQTRME